MVWRTYDDYNVHIFCAIWPPDLAHWRRERASDVIYIIREVGRAGRRPRLTDDTIGRTKLRDEVMLSRSNCRIVVFLLFLVTI